MDFNEDDGGEKTYYQGIAGTVGVTFLKLG